MDSVDKVRTVVKEYFSWGVNGFWNKSFASLPMEDRWKDIVGSEGEYRLD